MPRPADLLDHRRRRARVGDDDADVGGLAERGERGPPPFVWSTRRDDLARALRP